MAFNPQNLAIFMIAATQTNYVDHVLPATGSPVFNKDNHFVRLGVDKQALNAFVAKFGGANQMQNRKKFQAVARLAETLVDYHPPDCPDQETLQRIVIASK